MALIPPFFMDCVVAIGKDDIDNKGKKQKVWIATGFLYGQCIGKNKDGENLYKTYLVTNRHVFENLSKIYLRFNPQSDEQAWDYNVNLLDENGSPSWIRHPNEDIDIALLRINFKTLIEHNIQANFFLSDNNTANIAKIKDMGITEGDFVFVLGFPMGLVGDYKNTVIVRNGTIARIRDAISKNAYEFLVDAFVFPGNSGGPVISKPEATAIKDTKSQNSANLIGIIKSYVPYQDIAISAQTRRPRVIFEENSGLASAHPVNFIEDIVFYDLNGLDLVKNNILPEPVDQVKFQNFIDQLSRKSGKSMGL